MASVAEALNAGSNVVRLSGDTATKKTVRHPEITPATYALVQQVIDEGEWFHDRERNRHVVGILEMERFQILVALNAHDRHVPFMSV